MELDSILESRYSVRSFKADTITKAQTNEILQTVLYSPTALNQQSQRVLVIESKTGLKKLRDATPYSFDAPLAFLICYDKNICAKSKFRTLDSGVYDASISATYILLKIVSMGLGATWVTHFDPRTIRKEFSIPNNIEPLILIPAGYPAKGSKPSPMHDKSVEVSDIVQFDAFSCN